MRLFNYNCQMLGDNIQIHTIGCEASMSDAYNFACTLPQDQKAIVFSTCSFIEDRSIESVMLTRILMKAYPDYKMYIIGCDVNLDKNKYDYCDNVYRNEDVAQIIKNRKILEDVRIKGVIPDCTENPIINIKVQDGCNFRCTYCIINKLRNKPYSVPYNELVRLIKEQIKTRPNYHTVVLSGTEVTSYYDEETGYHMSDVLRHLIKDIPEVKRITLSAIDPQPKEAEEIIKVVSSSDKFIKYILLGVQSGSDVILKLMKRRHNVNRVRQLHKLAKDLGVTLGWDIIIGFPGETEELFMETYNLMAELQPFTQNIFMYSDREGTEATQMNNKVPKDVQIHRDRMVHELMFKYSQENSYFNSFSEYADEAVRHEQTDVNRQRALEIMLEDETEHWLDIFDEDAVASFIKERPENTIIHIKYDMERDVESEIIIDFFKYFMRGIPLIVHVPEEFTRKYNVKDFENKFHCIIKVD